ncbi:hypothetical protein U9M48_006968 [Paspalum notatum var. saurae]|uniref:Uncharacterized protein n=1 Tax=Paspalum notatum var. saurae TaxID=547442 RepID=A0AAQ3SME1_PASNO
MYDSVSGLVFHQVPFITKRTAPGTAAHELKPEETHAFLAPALPCLLFSPSLRSLSPALVLRLRANRRLAGRRGGGRHIAFDQVHGQIPC